MTGAVADLVLDFSAVKRSDARRHRRSARAQSAFPAVGTRGTQTRRQSDGSLQPHNPGAAGPEDLAEFLASERVEVVASMPCYLRDNVEQQRGKGVYDGSIRGLKLLNAIGYGRDPALPLHLVYNPQGPSLLPRKPRSRPITRGCLASTMASCSTNCTCSPICRSNALDPCWSHAASSKAISVCSGRPPRCQSRRRDVPEPAFGRLARLCLRL